MHGKPHWDDGYFRNNNHPTIGLHLAKGIGLGNKVVEEVIALSFATAAAYKCTFVQAKQIKKLL